MAEPIIKISIEGGCFSGVAMNMEALLSGGQRPTIKVFDYDIEGASDEDGIVKDHNGDKCFVTEWTPEIQTEEKVFIAN